MGSLERINGLLESFGAPSLNNPDFSISFLTVPYSALTPSPATLGVDLALLYATHPVRHENPLIDFNPSHPTEPFSSITQLIQGVYENYPDQARWICRSRIYTTQPHLMPFCRGMVRVAAKRVTPLLQAPDLEISPTPLQAFDVTPKKAKAKHLSHSVENLNPRSLQDWMTWANQAAKNLPRHAIRHQSDRPIVALLLLPQQDGRNYDLRAAAYNQNARNRTLHAEVNLIQNWFRDTHQLIPAGAVVLTTLKPCKMCAALIWQCSQDRPSLQVFYSEMDPGKYAQNTALEPYTLDRELASADRAERELEIMKPLFSS